MDCTIANEIGTSIEVALEKDDDDEEIDDIGSLVKITAEDFLKDSALAAMAANNVTIAAVKGEFCHEVDSIAKAYQVQVL